MTTTLRKESVVQSAPTCNALQAQKTILSHHLYESLVFTSLSFVMFFSLLRNVSQQSKNQACCFSSQNNQWKIQPEICHYTLMTSLVGLRLVLLTYQLVQVKLEQSKQKTLLFEALHQKVSDTMEIRSKLKAIPKIVIDPAAEAEDILQQPKRSCSP